MWLTSFMVDPLPKRTFFTSKFALNGQGNLVQNESEHFAKTFARFQQKVEIAKKNFDRSKCEGLFAKSLN